MDRKISQVSQTRYQGKRIQNWRRAIGYWSFASLNVLINTVHAEIATDGTVGPATSLTGPNFEIGANLGTTKGANLFHSFQTFNINAGESATFTGPDAAANVISRVTGGEFSSIDGVLRSQVGTADFYFINPAGVVFGPNAQVEVPAAFHVSTADELRFQDGAIFSTSAPDSSTLSLAQPESFGFLSPQPASLTVNGSQLEFSPASRVTMLANDVTVQNGASLLNESGAIDVTAVGESEAMVDVTSGSTDSPAVGTIAIHESSTLDVSGSLGTEPVELRGGTIEVENSTIAADNSGAEDGVGHILLEADSVHVTNSDVGARVFGTGRGNGVVVVASELEVDATTATDGVSRLMTRVVSGAAGQAGDVQIEADRVSLMNGGHLSSIAESSATGPGGMVRVQATEAVTIEGANDSGNFSGIYTMSLSEGDVDGGSILIEAPQALITIAEGGILQTGTAGAGNAGSVTIDANDLLIEDESGIWTFTQAKGNGGDVNIEANHSISMDNADIDTSTYDAGTGGRITVTAKELSLVNGSEIMADTHSSGEAGNINMEVSGPVALRDSSSIEAATTGDGPAGHVMLKTGDLSLMNRSVIGAPTLSSGTGGDSTIEVYGNFHIDSDSTLTSGILDFGTGTAGVIRVIATRLELSNGGRIHNSTMGNQNAGAIVVEASGIVINGGGMKTGILSETDYGYGSGGDIQITAAKRLELVNGGIISSSTYDEGVGGTVVVKADELLIKGGGGDEPGFTGIFGKAFMSSGAAGNVHILANQKLEIVSGGAISSSTTSGEADAGVVSVETAELVIDGEGQFWRTGIFAELSGSSGNANEVQVTATDRLFIHRGGEISSKSFSGKGNGGNVTIIAAELIIDGQGEGKQELANGIEVTRKTGIFSDTRGTLSGVRSGTAGNVRVTATERLELRNEGEISSGSGFGGGGAGGVNLNANELVMEAGGLITTSAINVDGGHIAIDGGILQVSDSIITTSVSGESGNGGDIALSPDLLVLDGGFIQANTAAPLASGGDILINTKALVASGGEVQIGGVERAEFQAGRGANVIQAAAPGGEQGTVTITAPELDISGTLANLASGFFEPAQLVGDPCALLTGKAPSSLVQGTRGGVPTGPKGPASVSFAGERLDRLLSAPHSPVGKSDSSITKPSGEESSVVGDQVDRCRLRETL
jgi:filamentous hemagglutinin family protein